MCLSFLRIFFFTSPFLPVLPRTALFAPPSPSPPPPPPPSVRPSQSLFFLSFVSFLLIPFFFLFLFCFLLLCSAFKIVPRLFLLTSSFLHIHSCSFHFYSLSFFFYFCFCFLGGFFVSFLFAQLFLFFLFFFSPINYLTSFRLSLNPSSKSKNTRKLEAEQIVLLLARHRH